VEPSWVAFRLHGSHEACILRALGQRIEGTLKVLAEVGADAEGAEGAVQVREHSSVRLGVADSPKGEETRSKLACCSPSSAAVEK
jgi:hypothetical protein